MSILWSDRKPGETASPVKGEEDALLIGETGVGDWVRLPPELGGNQVKIVSVHAGECPTCKARVKHMLLDSDNLGVAECKTDGFLWYRKRV
jgi:hypothetical protein